MRKQFVLTTESAMARDPRIVVLLGDIGVFGFRKAFSLHPDRIYNIGICEQTMTGMAAGLAMEGYIPIIHSIAPFVVERCFEQLKIDLCYQRCTAKIVSVGASYDYAALGCTHHCPGDVHLLRSLPGMCIVVPGTAAEFDVLFRGTYADGRATYYRLSERANLETLPVVFGKGLVVREGRSGTVLAVGPTLRIVLEAAERLDVTVLYYTTLSPFDAHTLRDHCPSGKVVVVEPFYEGTLAYDVAGALRDLPARVRWVGVPRGFCTSYGRASDHDGACGLTAPSIRSIMEGFFLAED